MKVTTKILVATMAALLLVGSEARAGVIYTTATDEGDTITSGVGLASTITSSGFDSGTFVGNLTVTLNISGGNNGDLYGYLSYNGVLVTILNRPGVGPSNPFGDPGSGYNITINDLAGINLGSATGTFGSQTLGSYNVNGNGNGALAFGAYNAQNPNGTWTLYLENGVSGGDPSTLVSWSIAINAVPEPTNVALGIFGVCAIAGRARAGWKKSRAAAGKTDTAV
jgi:hypothetical protein